MGLLTLRPSGPTFKAAAIASAAARTAVESCVRFGHPRLARRRQACPLAFSPDLADRKHFETADDPIHCVIAEKDLER